MIPSTNDRLAIGSEPRRHAQIEPLRIEKSPLHLAVLNGSIGIVQILIDAGADINVRCSGELPGIDLGGFCQDGRTPLEIATLLRDENMVRLLVSYGANVNHQPASTACCSASQVDGTFMASEQYIL